MFWTQTLLLFMYLTIDVNSKVQNIKIGIIHPKKSDIKACSHYIKVTAAINIAVNTVNQIYKDVFAIEPFFKDSECKDTTGIFCAMDFYNIDKVHVFFGPCCKFALSTVARLNGERWQLPLISLGGWNDAFLVKDAFFPLLTRAMGTFSDTTYFLKAILDNFNYKHVTFMYHDNYITKYNGQSTCSDLASSFGWKHREVMKINFQMFDEFENITVLDDIFGTILQEKVRPNSRGWGVLHLSGQTTNDLIIFGFLTINL
ncbi:unnamed protein product [Dimorphilus gyrociliatus]|uniref:Receptor ligand binding region domain-containing protein n=1 Tax=Dimorphilus gyrociliatus TaxID=2664684 RepID=A0A7I8V687_9ANNE|nr:unnamed protein product [Dimorphilus gyrociliatus]